MGFAEVTRPQLLPIKVVAVEACRTEPAVKTLTIGRRRGGRKVGIVMRAFVWDMLAGLLTPDFFAGVPVEAYDLKLIKRIWMRNAEDTFWLVFRFGPFRIDTSGVDCRQDENFVSPDDGRRVAFAVDRDFPLNVLVFAPFNRGLCRATDSVCFRTSPLVPVDALRVDI
jgi:hypothetical protein